MILQLTFVDEVGSQLDSLDLGRGVGRQLVPGLLYIENDNGQQQQKQNTYKVTCRCEMSFLMTCPGLLRRIKIIHFVKGKDSNETKKFGKFQKKMI